ncbi:hypothetical protein ABFT23_22340 [Nocardioides sp. C4-1]|uniref:hypothetical protein n=1 Tax=Nocardioides sp. C4-1 TaxID=3151851 RepID=UPI0032673317
MSRPAHRALLAVLVVGVLAVAGAAVAVLGGSDAEVEPTGPTTPPTVAATPLADLDTRTTAIARASFCDALPPEVVERALGGPATETTSYDDGEPARVTGRVRDVAHEFGCGWSSATSSARAWVFAPPVTRASATDLVSGAARQRGCTRVDGASPYGAPSVALTCTTKRGEQVSFRGLFGDAWLTCELTAPASASDDVVARADRWCAAVVNAASTPAG